MRVNICSNPKCHREIEEPILLNDLSKTPIEHYYACPHCFTKLYMRAYMRTSRAGIFLSAFGSIIMAWVICLAIQEMTLGSRDIVLIFFGSRTGEAIGLGIGMKVIYYFLIGSALLILGLRTSLRRRRKATELHLSATAPNKENTCTYDMELTLRLPKKLVDFLKAQEEHMGATVEKYIQDSVFGRVTADLDALDESVLTPKVRAQLIEEYGLKEILKDR